MGGFLQADLSFLFEGPSLWRALVQSLIVVLPLTIALSGYAAWREGDRSGLLTVFWVALYLIWALWPRPLPPELVLPGRVISVIGWFWLIAEWGRRAKWHQPFLLVVNGIVLAVLIALALTTGIAFLRDFMGWDIPG